jgi:hypothetical protein
VSQHIPADRERIAPPGAPRSRASGAQVQAAGRMSANGSSDALAHRLAASNCWLRTRAERRIGRGPSVIDAAGWGVVLSLLGPSDRGRGRFWAVSANTSLATW